MTSVSAAPVVSPSISSSSSGFADSMKWVSSLSAVGVVGAFDGVGSATEAVDNVGGAVVPSVGRAIPVMNELNVTGQTIKAVDRLHGIGEADSPEWDAGGAGGMEIPGGAVRGRVETVAVAASTAGSSALLPPFSAFAVRSAKASA